MEIEMTDDTVVLLMTKKEAELLAAMIGQEVIGSPAAGVGITDGLNAGLEYNDPYWDTEVGLTDALIFARDLLVHLGWEKSSVREANKFIKMAEKWAKEVDADVHRS